MRTARWLVGIAVIAVIAVAVVVGLRNFAAKTPPPNELAKHPECGHNRSDTVKIVQVQQTIDVPEFNDCQRFVVPDGNGFKYDSLFAIFASQTLGSLESRLATPHPITATSAKTANTTSTTTTTIAANTKVAVNTKTNPPIQNLAPPGPTAAMVAVVYGGGPYDSLGIQKDLNCLYVWRTENPETWHARMVPEGLTTTSCPDTALAALPGGKDLKVSRAQAPGFTQDADYPPVARWDWDAAHAKQYVGIKCGAAWCEIYDGDLTSSPALPVTGGDPVEVKRVRLIKGWYDQQFLATFDASGKPVPSPVLGTIVPDPMLADKTDDDFEHHWVHVADISLDAPDGSDGVLDAYKAKFNFVKSKITDPVTLSIKGKPGVQFWKARIKRPGLLGYLTLKHKNVLRREVTAAFTSTGYKVPGVTRWRWMTTDEGTWTRCTAGCCEMSDY